VRNTGTVVDQFSFEPLGDAAAWVSFEPATLSLFPGTDGTTRVIIQTPTGSEARAGACPVGVRVVSKEDPTATSVEEFTLDVGELANVTAEIIPRTSRGRRSSVVQVAVDNRGNSRVNADIKAEDPDDQLGFAANPPTIVAEPGTATFARMKVAPRKRFLRGPNVTHPYSVTVQPEGQAPVVTQGTMLQEPLMPKWLPRAILGALAAALVLFLLGATLLKSRVDSSAEDAVRDQVTPAIEALNAQIAALAAGGGQEAPPPVTLAPPDGGGGGGGGGSEEGNEDGGAAGAGDPFDGQLAATAADQSPKYTVPGDKVLNLTDIILQNPEGDAGVLRIKRGDNDLLVVRLENFRDLDYHFVAPIRFDGDDTLTFSVACQNPPEAAKPCTPSMLFSGSMSDG
jgi:hypothetical protein